jgi:NitT/TauT family transport system substrate-binding protein
VADAACLTLDEVLRARVAGIPLTVILVFDVSAGADMVLARPAIKTLKDLAGKRIGVEKSALGALIFEKILELSGLPASAITLVDLPPEQLLEAWRTGRIDAAIAYEPSATHLAREGAVRIFDSRQMPDTIFDVLAVRSDRITHNHEMLEHLLVAHFKALEHLQTNREDAMYRIAARQGISPEDVRQALSGVILPSLPTNRSYLVPADSHLMRAATMLSALMARRDLLVHEDTLQGLIHADILPHTDQL